MLANLQSTKEILVRKAHCEERIEYYQGQYDMSTDDKGRNKAKRMLDQWRAKLSDVDSKESAAKKYDAIVGPKRKQEICKKRIASEPQIRTGKRYRSPPGL